MEGGGEKERVKNEIPRTRRKPARKLMPEKTALHGTGSLVYPKPDSRCHHIEMWLQESQSHTDSFSLYAVPPMSPLKK